MRLSDLETKVVEDGKAAEQARRRQFLSASSGRRKRFDESVSMEVSSLGSI